MNKDLKNSVLEKIQKEKISMYPKSRFIVRTGIIVLLSVVVFSCIVFVLSFIFFSIHESGEQFLLGFGTRGVITFLELFPWVTLILTLLLLLLLEWLLRYFKFSYQISIMRIFLYTIVVTLCVSILFTFTPLHSSLLKKAELNKLPIVGGIYDAIHDSHQDKGVLRGAVISIQSNSFVISHNDNDKDADDGTWNVIVPAGFDISKIHIGEKVYVAGNASKGVVYAYGIGEIISSE